MSDRYTSKQLTDHCFDKVNISSNYILQRDLLQRDLISGKTYDTNFIKKCINTEDSLKHFFSFFPSITSLFEVTNNIAMIKYRVQKNITRSIYELILHKRKRLYSIILY